MKNNSKLITILNYINYINQDLTKKNKNKKNQKQEGIKDLEIQRRIQDFIVTMEKSRTNFASDIQRRIQGFIVTDRGRISLPARIPAIERAQTRIILPMSYASAKISRPDEECKLTCIFRDKKHSHRCRKKLFSRHFVS